MFLGEEIEATPMFGSRTLFVVGLEPKEKILIVAHSKEINHVYLGARNSFVGVSDEELPLWDSLANSLLDLNFTVTLDFPVSLADKVAGMTCVKRRNLIPFLAITLDQLHLFNRNRLAVKLIDLSNDGGVWATPLYMLHKTNWLEYQADKETGV